MKWRALTPDQLRAMARELSDVAHDMEVDREQVEEESGFDVVAAYGAIARRLSREAKRREARDAATAKAPVDVSDGPG